MVRKPKATVRKPPKPDTAAVEQFVKAGTAPAPPSSPGGGTYGRKTIDVRKRDNVELKRLTVRIPLELYDRLSRACHDQHVTMGDALAAAAEQWLRDL